jgi:hypothetical protein
LFNYSKVKESSPFTQGGSSARDLMLANGELSPPPCSIERGVLRV